MQLLNLFWFLLLIKTLDFKFGNKENKMKKDLKTELQLNKIYNTDCLLLIKKMIEQNFKVDMILTDPPYNISRKNNFHTIGRNGIDFGKWDKEFDQTNWLTNIHKIIKNGGSIIIFNDWRNLGLIAQKLEKEGFIIKDILRWIKPNPMPRNTTRRYVTDYEFAIWATYHKGKWTFNKKADKAYLKPEFIHSVVIGNKRIHPTEKSISLMEQIIEIHTNEGDIIFDPFSGSGAISYAASKLNRFYIGSEISKTYFDKSLKRIKELYIKPTINHLGNKYRMIDELIANFPKNNIDYFIDVFAGSGVVSINYKTPKIYYLNDKDTHLTQILKFLIENKLEIILQKIDQIVTKYNLPTQPNLDFKTSYNHLKNDFNLKKTVDKLLVLTLFGFNQQIRFNSEGLWNIPPGKFCWNAYQRNKLTKFCEQLKNKQINASSMNFDDFVKRIKLEINKKKTKSLFYFDPPYLISNATYNANWSEAEEAKLIEILQDLTDRGYKWCLSNLLFSKGKENKLLKDFINKNQSKLKVEYFGNINYFNSNYQRKNKNNEDIEILVKGNL